MARKIVSDIIEWLDIIARNYDHYEFGLPSLQRMILSRYPRNNSWDIFYFFY